MSTLHGRLISVWIWVNVTQAQLHASFSNTFTVFIKAHHQSLLLRGPVCCVFDFQLVFLSDTHIHTHTNTNSQAKLLFSFFPLLGVKSFCQHRKLFFVAHSFQQTLCEPSSPQAFNTYKLKHHTRNAELMGIRWPLHTSSSLPIGCSSLPQTAKTIFQKEKRQ